MKKFQLFIFYINLNFLTLNSPEVPVFEEVIKLSSKYPADKPAFIDYDTEFTITYGDLPKFIFTIAKNLQEQFNVVKNDVIAFLLPNHPLFVVLFHGINKAGAIVTPMNPLNTPNEIRKQLADSNARILITIPLFAANVFEASSNTNLKTVLFLRAKDQLGTPLPTSESLETHDVLTTVLRPPQNTDFTSVPIDPINDISVLPYSSGTTGVSKGVCLTHHNLVSNMYQITHLEKFEETDILFGVLPLFHIYGFLLLNLRSVADGCTVIIVPKFDFVQFLTAIQKYKISRAHIVPPIILALANHPIVDKFDTSSLNGILSGAAPLSKELTEKLVARFSKNNPNFQARQGYGLTETSPVISVSLPNKVIYGSSGVLVSNTELRIVDPSTGEDLDVDQEGEIVVRGPQCMKGYLNNEEATNHMLRNGWLHTGDIGRIDSEGNLFVTDRLKELIKYKGYQVPPAELEALLLTMEGIADCAVVGVPDDEAGEIPKAFVVLKEGVTLTEEEICKYTAEKVAPYKKIRQVEFISQIPKSSSGKILRRQLKK